MHEDHDPGRLPPELRSPGILARIRPHVLDLTPLRESADLRRLLLAGVVSELGNQATLVAIPFHVYAITRSTVAVGLVAVAQLIPRLLIAPLGGHLADRVDRSRLAIGANLVFAILSLGLVGNALLAEPMLWPMYLFAAAAGAVSAMYVPSIRAWPARLVDTRLLPSAFALEGASYNANALLGPALAGLLIAGFGVQSAYTLDVVSFLVAIVVLWGIAPSRPQPGSEHTGSVAEGWRVLAGQPIIRTVLGLDFVAMFWGMPLALLPALAHHVGVGPGVLGLWYAAPAAGGLIAAAASGSASRLRRPGRGIVLALLVWGAAIVVLGLSLTAWVTWLALAVAGGANEISAILGTAVTQSVVVDDVRGRLAALDDAVSAAGPALGDLEAGVAAAWIGLGPAIVIGGVGALIGVGVLAAVGRSLRSYRPPPAESSNAGPLDPLSGSSGG